MPDINTVGALFEAAGVWVSFLLTLFIASLLVRDNAVASFAQHLLVGVTFGYAAVAAIQLVLRPRLFAPLLQGGTETIWLWAPLILGMLLLGAGIERSLRQGRMVADEPSASRRLWQVVRVIPVALLLGIAVAAGLLGVIQGTLSPLFWQAAVAGLWWSSSTSLWEGGLALALTIAVLMTLTFQPDRHLARLPRLFRVAALGVVWLGQRALWVAAGMLFARLFASRLSLVIERMTYLVTAMQQIGLQRWLESIWLNMTR